MHRSTGCQWGLPVRVYQGDLLLPGNGDFHVNPSPFPRGRELRENCTPLTFETPAGLLLASDSRITMRAARHAPGSLPKKGRTLRFRNGRRSCRMWMEFGGI